jgi:uncharacterized protein YfkK (UPF0435 family)
MDRDQKTAKQFVQEAVSATRQLDEVIGKPWRPERPVVMQRGQDVYEDLIRRRGSLVLSPMTEWAVDLMLDGIRSRLQILNESTYQAAQCDSIADLLNDAVQHPA